MGKLYVALFGLGRAGQFHLTNISRHPRMKLLYAIDAEKSKADEVAANFECIGLTSGEVALADPKVNAVIIATPTPTHYQLILDAIQAKKPIFTEKPVGFTLAEIDKCYEEAKQANIPLLCGFNRRFDRSWMKVVDAVHKGKVGTPQIVRTTARDNPVPTVTYLETSHGFFHDSGVHDIDIVRWVLQEEPTEVYAVAQCHLPQIKAINDVDTVLMTLKFKSGVIANIDLSRKSVYGYDQRLEVFGDKGLAQVDNKPSTSAIFSSTDGVLHDNVMFSFPQRFEEAYYLELDHFVRVVLENEPMRLTHTDSRNVYIIAETARHSASIGKPVVINYDVKECEFAH